MPPRIHPTAIVGPEVEIDPTAEVGPFCFLDGKVRIGARTRLIAHVTVFGDTEIGTDNIFHPNVVVGDAPQDITYTGAPRRLRIGNRNVFREGATVHRGSESGDVTIIGDNCYLMQNSHVGHDCRIGNGVIIAGGALIAGWAEVGDRAFISGNCVVHQFVRIGRLAMMRGRAGTSRDLPPFCILEEKHTLRAINVVGLRRAGFSSATIRELHRAFRALFITRQNLKLALERLIASGPHGPEVNELIDFIRSSRRGVAFGPKASGASEEHAD